MDKKEIQDKVIEAIKSHNLCYNYQTIQEIQLDNEQGETEYTLEVYYTSDGYIYNIVFTDETTGKEVIQFGNKATELATRLLERETPLIESI